MKKHTKKIVAILLTLCITLVGGGALFIAANETADGDVNMHLLGKSGTIKEEKNSERPALGASEEIDKEPNKKPVLGQSKEKKPVQLGVSMRATTFGIAPSIGGIISVADKAKVAIVPGTDGSAYQAFAGTYAGLQEAVSKLYTDGNGADYVLYMGTAITIPAGSPLVAEIPAPLPIGSDASFVALKGKVGTLALVSSHTDPANSTNTAAGDSVRIGFPTESYFGTNITLRNIQYTPNTFYMLGNSLTMDHGSYFFGGFNLFGGNKSGNATGSPTITTYSTGSGTFNLFGGNKGGGTLTGSPTITINNTSTTPINVLSGGSESGGTINGDINLTINGMGATNAYINQLFAGGRNGTVNGSVATTIHTTGSYVTTLSGGNYYGVVNGNVTTIINDIKGNVNTLIGGTYSGEIVGNVSTTINKTSGNVVTIYGAGVGTANVKAKVDGNVDLTINNLGGTFNNIIGGMEAGTVTGSITNTVKGTGGAIDVANFTGGSYDGNVGASLASGSDAIINNFDTSAYSVGRIHFAGGNDKAGTIYGNIKSKVTAGGPNKGSMRSISGGSGYGSLAGSNFMSPESFDKKTAAEVHPLFLAQAKISVYGDIYTEITKGTVSDGSDRGWTRGAGYAGYVQGNSTVLVGTEGKATSEASVNTSMQQSSSLNERGYYTSYDIVGGGGSPGYYNNIYIQGNTHVKHYNTLARWTYGGNFSGLLEGNSKNELYGGIVDTLEGTGYINQQQWGNGHAHVYDGQVDWFLSGGGWGDRNLYGDVSVTVEGGTINASMGATYGGVAPHTLNGNATMLVTNGNFSGRARGGLPNGFSGGPTYAGHLTGNTSVTLDLRDIAGTFVLPNETYICGGRPYDASGSSILGTDANNTIELNVFTKEGDNILNGASIYGDGGTSAAQTRSGKITVNIDAPSSTVGNFFATQYPNVASPNILRDVTFNIHDVEKIDGISGGNATDNITNAIAQQNTNKVRMNVNPTGTNPKTITLGTVGLINFTDLSVNNAQIKVTGAGGVKNGRLVTVANHGTTYHQFGNINLSNNAGLFIEPNASALISGSLLSVSGKATLQSPSDSGKIIVADAVLGANDSIHWIRNQGAATSLATGTWFGAQKSYKVITFSPNPAKAVVITPHNFTGEDSGIPLMGDNAPFNATLGHGVAVPGTRVNFKVVGGLGAISHNVDKVSASDSPLLNGASSVAKNTPVQDGWITITDTVSGALTFTPDSSSESWIKQITITRSDGTQDVVPEFQNTGSYVWPITPKGFTYEIEVEYTDTSELSGKSVMLTEAEAMAITTAQDVMNYQAVSGRPFFTSTIDATFLNAIKQPLGATEKIRSHTVTYTSGVGGNLITRNYMIGVVPNTVVIDPADRRVAIDAQDATMMLAIAQGMTENTLNTAHTYPVVYFPDGTTATPTLVNGSTIISTLNGLTLAGVVPAEYSYTLTGPANTVKKAINITVIPDGELKIDSVPVLDFGQTAIPSALTKRPMPTATSVVIEDSRVNPYGSTWTVQLTVSDLETTDGKKILAQNVFYTNARAAIGAVGIFPLDTVTTIWASATNAANTQQLDWVAAGSEGFSIAIDPTTVLTGDYEGIATWTLVPGP